MMLKKIWLLLVLAGITTMAVIVSASSVAPSVVADIGGGTCCGTSILIVGVSLLIFVIYMLKRKKQR